MSADTLDPREGTLPIFVQAIRHYFDHVAGEPAETETPYLLDGSPEMSDFTAVIGISGDLQGCVYYTAPGPMLDALLNFAGEFYPTDELRRDMAGEVANTLSGNGRRQLGPGFMISVPMVMQGPPARMAWPKDTACFVIPITLRHMRSLLLLCLSDHPPAEIL